MQSRRALGNGQIEVMQSANARAVQVTVTVSRTTAGAAPANIKFLQARDSVFDWARVNLGGVIATMLEAQLNVLPFDLGEQVVVDPESGEHVLYWDAEKLVNILEAASPEQFPEALRAPEVADAQPSIAPPPPHPAPAPPGDMPLRTAQRVAYLKSELLATGHVNGRSVRTVACEMVARESDRTWDAVSTAERRGRKHRDFSESDLPLSAREPLLG